MVEITFYTDSLHLQLRIDPPMIWAVMQMIVWIVGWLATYR